MPFLTDEDLVELVEPVDKKIISDLDQKSDYYSAKSQFQPCSFDFTVGEIFLPGKIETQAGGAKKPLENHPLEPGQTAVIVTKEKLDLPSDLAGFGFPPSRLSVTGLLMTNPGHIDPGTNGHLHFTLINMGRKEILLSQKEVIFTALFYRLEKKVIKNLAERNATNNIDLSYKIPKLLNSLSADFLNINSRASDQAKKEIENFDLKTKLINVRTTLISASIPFLVAIATLFITFFSKENKTQVELETLNTRIENVESTHEKMLEPANSVNLYDLNLRIEQLEKEMN